MACEKKQPHAQPHARTQVRPDQSVFAILLFLAGHIPRTLLLPRKPPLAAKCEREELHLAITGGGVTAPRAWRKAACGRRAEICTVERAIITEDIAILD
jgi:hypothetical protein